MTLGQTEAFEVAPSKKLIVPSGCSAWWGVDPSTLRVAIATISEDSQPQRHRSSSIASFDKAKQVIDRLPEIREYTRQLAVMLAGSRPPGVIVVEKPACFGDRPNPELAYGVGAILCGLGEAVRGSGVSVVLVESSKWKRVACGSGAIKKPKPSSGIEYPVLTWAKGLGFAGNSRDEADAWGIAEYACRTYALEER